MENRPVIPKAKVDAFSSPEEAFQNIVLRPIIKMKHDLLIAFTKNYLTKKKNDLGALSLEKQQQYVITCFAQDHTLRGELRGLIIGQFTVAEFDSYAPISNAINKRIINIVKERMIDHISLLSS